MRLSRNGAQRGRLVVVLVLLGIMIGTTAATTEAQTSAETGVSITIVDEGGLDIGWISADTPFLVDGDAPAVYAGHATVALVNVSFAVDDTRADANRSGYTVRLSAGTFTAEGSSSVIDAGQLAVADVTGPPEGDSPVLAIGQTLDSPVAVLAVGTGAEAVSATVTVTIEMIIPPGTMPGTYHGGLTFDVLPVDGP